MEVIKIVQKIKNNIGIIFIAFAILAFLKYLVVIKNELCDYIESLPEPASVSEYCDLVKIESGVSETIYYDKNTKIMYCLINTDEYSGITPIYNADGTLKVYKENPNN